MRLKVFTVILALMGVVIGVLIAAFPQDLGLQLRTFGLSGTVVDVFLADSGVQLICAICAATVIGYGGPLVLNGVIKISAMRRMLRTVLSVRREPRTLDGLSAIIDSDVHLSKWLAPVDQWVNQQVDDFGNPQLEARRLPSELLSPELYARAHGFSSTALLIPYLIFGICCAIIMVILARGADHAFAELLSVASADNGTMMLSIRSAAAAMAVALLVATLLVVLQTWFRQRIEAISKIIMLKLNQLVILERQEVVLAPSPAAPGETAPAAELSKVTRQVQKQLALIQHNIAALQENGGQSELIAQLRAQISAADSTQTDLSRSLQQSLDELQQLRSEMADLRSSNVLKLPIPAQDPAVDRLTSAIKTLKENAAFALPKL